jgi:hypothetical protein
MHTEQKVVYAYVREGVCVCLQLGTTKQNKVVRNKRHCRCSHSGT